MAAIRKWSLQSSNGTPGGRQKLTPLQKVADQSGLTRPSTPLKGKLSRNSGQIKIYEDPRSTECVTTETQTEISAMNSDSCVCVCHDEKDSHLTTAEGEDEVSADALELMSGGSFEVPEKYWEVLAESRREALEDSLHENEMLHQLVSELKEENKKLDGLASQADYFAKMLETLTGSEDTTTEENESDSDEVSSDSGKATEEDAS